MDDSFFAQTLQEDSPGDRQRMFELPPEIWAQITCHVTIYDLGRMKNTGSKALWRKICEPRAVSTINVTISQTSLKSWPALLDEFKWITSLSFTYEIQSEHRFVGAKLDMMPKTLKKLEIKLPKLYLADFAYRPDGADRTLVQYVPNLEHLTMDLDWNCKEPWMGQMPPNLTFLSCSSWDRSHPLPPTLIHFKTNHISGEESLIETDFPFGLEYLTLVNSRSDLAISKLPQHLQHFECKYSKYSPDLIDQLPRTLTSLILPRTSFKDSERAPCLPPRLTTLVAYNILPSLWKCLPPGLKTLEMTKVSFSLPAHTVTIKNPQNGHTRAVEALYLGALPATLTQLTVSGHPRIHPFWLAYDDSVPSVADNHVQILFPPGILSLKVDWRITSSAAKLLPTTLAELHTSHMDGALCKLLPCRLKTLSVDRAILSVDLVQNLPPTLTSLTFEFREPETYFIDEFTGEEVKYQGLKDLEARSWKMCEYRLPRTLTSLTWSRAFVGREFLAQQNFKHLKTLNLRLCYLDWVDETISHLPQTLTSFQLGGNTGVTGKCFSQLPRDLTVLTVETLKDIDDDDIKHLPRGISTLDLSLAGNLTNSCVKDLPPALTILAMIGNHRLTMDAYPDLPASLRGSCGMMWTGEWGAYNGSEPELDHREIFTSTVKKYL